MTPRWHLGIIGGTFLAAFRPLVVRLGSALLGNCKTALLLLAAALCPVVSAWGQFAPVEPYSPDVPSIVAQQPPCYSQDDEGGGPSGNCGGGTCHRPLCSLLDRCSAATREVPWADWTACPINVGVFAGGMNGGPLIADWVGTTTGFDGGWRVGWDVDPKWAPRCGLPSLR